MTPAHSDSAPSSTVACAAIVVAGGSGHRFGAMKQYADLRGRRVLDFSLAAARSACDLVVLVVPARLVDRDEPAADVVVAGGTTRSASVRAGLAAVPDDHDVVVVHDAARPLAAPALFARVVATVRGGADAAIPGVAVVDTLRRRDGHPLGVERDDLVAVQTPQAFRAAVLRRVHADGAAEATDDATLVSKAGGTVVVVPGDRMNLKITEPLDLLIADVFAAESHRTGDIEMPPRGTPGEDHHR